MERIYRDRYLTPEEAEKYRKIREQVDKDLPDLIEQHHQRMEKKVSDEKMTLGYQLVEEREIVCELTEYGKQKGYTLESLRMALDEGELEYDRQRGEILDKPFDPPSSGRVVATVDSDFPTAAAVERKGWVADH